MRKALALLVAIGVILLSVLLLHRPSSSGRSVTTLGDDSCHIDVEPLARIAGDHVRAGIVRAISEGYALESRDEIAMFRPNGSFIRTIGRRGLGPGEFNRIQALLPMPDARIAAVESNPPRLTVLNAEGTVERVVTPLPVTIRREGALLLPDSTYVLMGTMSDRSLFGHPMARLSEDGKVLAYFGNNEAETQDPLRGFVVPRHLAFDGDNIISLKWYKYTIEAWDLSGNLQYKLEPPNDWFSWPPASDGSQSHEIGTPEEYFRGIQVDDRGRLWVLAQIAAYDWREGVSNGQLDDIDRWLDTRIEVVDLSSRQVVCSGRFEPYVLGGFVDSLQIATYRELSSGAPEITIWRLSLK